jgi:hypothetical protein
MCMNCALEGFRVMLCKESTNVNCGKPGPAKKTYVDHDKLREDLAASEITFTAATACDLECGGPSCPVKVPLIVASSNQR